MFSGLAATIAFLSVTSFHGVMLQAAPKVLATHEFSLETRYTNNFVNDVFKDNILLTLAYLRGGVSKAPVNWTEVTKPFQYTLTLQPGEVFAFDDSVLDQFKGKKGYTTNAHFNSQEGFKSDGYLVGDGVCHLASLLYWVAKDAGLDSLAPTNHNFAEIQGVPREYGVAIFYQPNEQGESASQNLYVTNNKDKAISFVFKYDGKTLAISALEN